MHNTETSSLVKQHSTDFVVYVAVYSVPGTTTEISSKHLSTGAWKKEMNKI